MTLLLLSAREMSVVAFCSIIWHSASTQFRAFNNITLFYTIFLHRCHPKAPKYAVEIWRYQHILKQKYIHTYMHTYILEDRLYNMIHIYCNLTSQRANHIYYKISTINRMSWSFNFNTIYLCRIYNSKLIYLSFEIPIINRIITPIIRYKCRFLWNI